MTTLLLTTPKAPPRPPFVHASPFVRRVVGTIFLSSVIASYVGTAFSPYLLTQHPLLLLMLAPVGRHVALAAPITPLVPLIAVVVARRVLALSAAWALGAIYGPAAVAWVDKRSRRASSFVRFVERLFARWGEPLLLIFPTHLLCALAGAAGTRALSVVVLVGLGELAWTLGAFYFGSAISPWTQPLLAFLAAHVIEATLVSICLIVLYQWFKRRATQASSDADSEPNTLTPP